MELKRPYLHKFANESEVFVEDIILLVDLKFFVSYWYTHHLFSKMLCGSLDNSLIFQGTVKRRQTNRILILKHIYNSTWWSDYTVISMCLANAYISNAKELEGGHKWLVYCSVLFTLNNETSILLYSMHSFKSVDDLFKWHDQRKLNFCCVKSIIIMLWFQNWKQIPVAFFFNWCHEPHELKLGLVKLQDKCKQ